MWARAVICGAAFTGVLALPLLLEVSWQQECGTCGHQQAEVQVVVAAAARLLARAPTHLSPNGAAASYFPYLPAMLAFGVLSALHRSAVADRRIGFLRVAVPAVVRAMVSLRLRPEHRLRAGQLLAVMPMTALGAVTGGDDLPIVGLMILALVYFQRGRAFGAGAALGAAACMKLTA